MNICGNFDTVQPDILRKSNRKNAIKNLITIHSQNSTLPEITSDYQIAVLGVPEDRNSDGNTGCANAPDEIREKLYQLVAANNKSCYEKIVDLGNLKIDNNTENTYKRLSESIVYLLNRKIVPVILGGSQDLTFANYIALKQVQQTINLITIDSKLDIAKPQDSITSNTYLHDLISKPGISIFNYTNIGHQSYFVSQYELDSMNNAFFDSVRLGKARSAITETEPLVRDADLLSFDIGSIKQADAPANAFPSPNGFSSDEACQIARYAGLSNKLISFGLYEINPKYDINHQTSHLAAQIIWYFIEGFSIRLNDFPTEDSEKHTKFIVTLNNIGHNIVFYKSLISERWWMEIPAADSIENQNLIVAASYKDYQDACNQIVPDRWWKFFQKLS